jgi:hypothetical protein
MDQRFGESGPIDRDFEALEKVPLENGSTGTWNFFRRGRPSGCARRLWQGPLATTHSQTIKGKN